MSTINYNEVFAKEKGKKAIKTKKDKLKILKRAPLLYSEKTESTGQSGSISGFEFVRQRSQGWQSRRVTPPCFRQIPSASLAR